jgi:alpha-methylacyl-CoA racemase
MSAPLQGIRILDLTRLLPGPYCSLMLADMGADVIKIEEPGPGDYVRAMNPDMFKMLNRNKRGLCLDLRQAQQRDQFLALCKTADVVLEGFRPGVMDKLGAGYDTIKAINPKIVYAAITGFGQDGPYRDWPGHDLNYCGYSGLLHQTGLPGSTPSPISFQIADLAAGALAGAIGILAAVIRAQRQDEGGFVDISMTDNTYVLQVAQLASVNMRGAAPPRGGDMLTGGLPNYRVYECADGKYMALGALEPKFWHAFCAAVERPDLAKMPMAAGPSGEKIAAELVALFKQADRDSWAAKLADKGCCATPVLDPLEALDDPHARARGLVFEVDGKPQYRTPIRISGHEYRLERSAPGLGEHNAEILAEIQ